MRWSTSSVIAQRTASIWRLIYGKWFGAMVILCMVLGTILWFVTRDRLPDPIKIATGAKNGQYYLYADVLADIMETRTERSVIPLVTDGSVENQKLLAEGKAHLAIIQHGAVSMAGLTVIAPLYEDVVHVVVRKGSGIHSILDLSGKNVVIGPEGSGMRASSLDILDHYNLKPADIGDKNASYFLALADDLSLDAAIVTTGYVNADLKRLLFSGAFELLEIRDAEAISTRHAHFAPATIPRGLYHEGPVVPNSPIKTVATKAMLVADSEVPDPLVGEVVAALRHWSFSRVWLHRQMQETREFPAE
jgi:TRAP transporter TAXI family solute receptor